MTERALLVPGTSGAPERHAPGPPRPQTAGTLWLVRHGQSGWNVAGRIQGQSPAAPGLTATGREQAAEAARELARRAPRANLIVASDLTRAAETAEIIADHLGLPIEFDSALREQSFGDLEGHPAFAAPAEGEATGDVLDAFWADPFRKPPGGESVAGMYDRVHRALDRIAAAHPGADLIIVTHGGPVRVAGAEHPPAPGQPFPRTAIANASITPYLYRPPSR
jgi:probable phosphoglycerate mutase